ncbi:MAG: hypothetical protein WCY58_09910 [Mariniphaga sp.]|nr:hypothetical protein [Mariniphaga sp.]MDD4225509.1 hypothetical protein [Mariniphaga sp.]
MKRNNFKTVSKSVKILAREDLQFIEGGNPGIIFFIFEAIAAGILYDVWKQIGKAYIKSYKEHPEYFEGIPRGR